MFHSPVFSSKSWHEVHNQLERRAIEDVGKLDEKLFFDPRLAGALEKIVSNYALEVAQLSNQAGTATPTKFRTSNAEVDALQVPIPFSGDAASFHISPSYSHVIMVPAVEVRKDHLLVTVYEHGNPGKEIEDFMKRSNENLDRLREEVKRYDGELMKTVTNAAERRKGMIEERRRRDEKLPFKVDRGS